MIGTADLEKDEVAGHQQDADEQETQTQLPSLLGHVALQGLVRPTMPELIQIGTGAPWHCEETLLPGSAEDSTQVAGDSLEPVGQEGDDAQELARLELELQGEQALLVDEESSVAHPASLQLARNPLFHTEECRPGVGSGDSIVGACSICLLEFESGQLVTNILRCNHLFHQTCLQRWMESPPFSCPMCRSDAAELKDVAASPEGAAARRHGRQPMPKAGRLRGAAGSLPSSRPSDVVAQRPPSASSRRSCRAVAAPRSGHGNMLVGGGGVGRVIGGMRAPARCSSSVVAPQGARPPLLRSPCSGPKPGLSQAEVKLR